MSENEKDNKEFEFIKEQIVEKKRKGIKKRLFPTITTLGFAILFGVAAAATFALVEPRLYKLFHKEEEAVTPVSFPTQAPDNDTKDTTNQDETKDSDKPTPTPVIVKQSIEADVNDYINMNNDIRNIALDINKSIVNITSTYPVEDSWFGKSIEKTVSTTGVIVYNNKKDLLILVSLDRVKDAKNISLVFPDDINVDANLRDYVSDINLAVISVNIKDIPEIYMNNLEAASLGESYSLSVGNPIIALGSPNGYAGSMGFGMITSVGSSIGITDNRLDLFNIDIEDNENSDGIIVNLNGDVIGIMTRTLKEDRNKELCTAIGISELKPIIMMMGNKEPHIYFGVKTNDMTNQIKKEYDINDGIYVNEVETNSPAFKAGIQKGDIILKINNMAVPCTSDFNSTIAAYKPGNKLSVKILRTGGKSTHKTTIDVVIADKKK